MAQNVPSPIPAAVSAGTRDIYVNDENVQGYGCGDHLSSICSDFISEQLFSCALFPYFLLLLEKSGSCVCGQVEAVSDSQVGFGFF